MKQVLFRKGKVVLEDVPAPSVSKGSVLVRVAASCISAGTESARLLTSSQPLLHPVRARGREVIEKALDFARTGGVHSLFRLLQEKVQFGSVTGYSCSGCVEKVGEGVLGFQKGDVVACAGPEYAYHAEFVNIPKNLVVKLPPNLSFFEGSTMTVGTIALHGVRLLKTQLGETVGIIGLGVMGQIAMQILKSAGCKVVGLDVDPSRLALARSLGMDYSFDPTDPDCEEAILRCTDGNRADSFLVAASTEASEPVRLSIQFTRRMGRVVVLGEVGLNLDRGEMHRKEIELIVSAAYGPGRYDPAYEDQGMDYPLSYVRWTAGRNFHAYLDLLAEKKINLQPLIQGTFPIQEAKKAFSAIQEDSPRPLIVLLTYDLPPEATEGSLSPVVPVSCKPIPKKEKVVRIAVVGAGGFAKEVHLPNLSRLKNLYKVYAICSRSPENAKQIAKLYGAKYATTDYASILQDPEVDAILVATRHNLHAKMALQALQAGKPVFLEKPMAVQPNELSPLVEALRKIPIPFLVGFNRRFSHLVVKAKEFFSHVEGPCIIQYRVNTGYPHAHWIYSEEGGGKIIGEACHMLDFFQFFTGFNTNFHLYPYAVSCNPLHTFPIELVPPQRLPKCL